MSLEELHAPLLPRLAALLGEVPLPMPQRVLDLGCGSGAKRDLLTATWPGCRLFGLDHDLQALGLARGAGYAGLIAADAEALPLAAGSFDMIWCCATLGLLEHPEAALREAARVLRPGGRLLVVTATQAGVELIAWPSALQETLTPLLRPWQDQLSDPTLGDLPLAANGFELHCLRAWPLDHPHSGELSVADWARLRPLIAPFVAPATLAHCDEVAQAAEPVVVSLGIAVLAAVAET